MKDGHAWSTPRKMYFRPMLDDSGSILASDHDPTYNLTVMQYDIIQRYNFVFHGRKSLDPGDA